VHPVLIDLGFYQLPTYGVLLAVAAGVAMWTAWRRARLVGLDAGRIVDLALWLVIWALVGAKALLILVELPRYLRDPGELLWVVRSGGVFLGGFLAAVIAASILLRRYRLGFLSTFDVLSPSIALGHAIGRIGCLMAGCCWGASCHLPWAITYTDPRAAEMVGTPLHVAVHPFPVYSALFNLALYAVLAWLFRRWHGSGRVFATYLAAYGCGRFLLEYTRGDAARGFVLGGVLSTSQLISIGLVTAGVGLFWWVQRASRERG
jgi:phosphatidylglycerol---prolipoprotein diacylglyceryl transferase